MLFNFEGLRCLLLICGKSGKKPKPFEDGGVAQLGEHLFCTQGVRSSILLISTKRDEAGSKLDDIGAHSSGG